MFASTVAIVGAAFTIWQSSVPAARERGRVGGAQGDAMVVQYTRDVTAVLQQRSLGTGALVREVPLPGLGSVDLSGRREQSEVLYTYTDMTQPGATYQCGLRCPVKAVWLDARRLPLPSSLWHSKPFDLPHTRV